MEIVGGFMVMMSIIGLFLAVIWLIMPFVVLAIKGKQDRTLEVLEAVEKRLAALEARLAGPAGDSAVSAGPPGVPAAEPSSMPSEQYSAEKSGMESSAEPKTGGL